MTAYQTKPIPIDAWQWLPDDPTKAGNLLGELAARGIDFRVTASQALVVTPPKGPSLTVLKLSWIASSEHGIGAYSDEEFRKTYEPRRAAIPSVPAGEGRFA